MGFGTLHLVDPDTVDEVNLGPQGFEELEIGLTKVEAVARTCLANNSSIEVYRYARRFSSAGMHRHWTGNPNVVLLCVDSIEDRRLIWGALKDQPVSLVVDGRMSAETCRVISCAPGDPYYETTLFEPHEAFQGSCTARSTIYCASVAAGLMLAQVRKHLCGMESAKDRLLNLFADDFQVLG